MASLKEGIVEPTYKAAPGTQDKATFPSGAERGTETIQGWYMLSQIALRRYCEAMQEGSAKYKPFNYLKGIPITNLLDHMQTHISQFLQGDSSEDHLGHAFWNLASIIQFSETRLDLFDGLPPGCKEAMIEWLQRTDEGSNRFDAIPLPSREEYRPEDCRYDSAVAASPLPNIEEMQRKLDDQQRHIQELERWKHTLQRERDDAEKTLSNVRSSLDVANHKIDILRKERDVYRQQLHELFTTGFTPSPLLAKWLEEMQREGKSAEEQAFKESDPTTSEHRQGWEAAFEYLIKKCLSPTPTLDYGGDNPTVDYNSAQQPG